MVILVMIRELSIHLMVKSVIWTAVPIGSATGDTSILMLPTQMLFMVRVILFNPRQLQLDGLFKLNKVKPRIEKISLSWALLYILYKSTINTLSIKTSHNMSILFS